MGQAPSWGPGFFAALFWGWRKRRGACRGGGGREAPTPQGRGPLAPALAAVLRALGPQNAAAPAWPGQPFYALGQPPYGRRRRTGTGEAGAVGYAPGRRRLAAGAARRAAPGLPNKRARPGPLAPGALFQGASRPAAAPRALGFCTAAPAGKAGRGARAFCRPWNGGCRARA